MDIGSVISMEPTEAVSIVTAQKIVDHTFAGWGVADQLHFLATGRARKRNAIDVLHGHKTAPLRHYLAATPARVS